MWDPHPHHMYSGSLARGVAARAARGSIGANLAARRQLARRDKATDTRVAKVRAKRAGRGSLTIVDPAAAVPLMMVAGSGGPAGGGNRSGGAGGLARQPSAFDLLLQNEAALDRPAGSRGGSSSNSAVPSLAPSSSRGSSRRTSRGTGAQGRAAKRRGVKKGKRPTYHYPNSGLTL